MIGKFRKTIAAGVAALAIGGATIAASSPAEARWRGGYGYGGGAVAAGVIGGLALGALATRPYYGYGYGYAPAYGAYPVAPAYYGPGYGYGPTRCWRQNRPVHDQWGNFVGYRAVRVCR